MRWQQSPGLAPSAGHVTKKGLNARSLLTCAGAAVVLVLATGRLASMTLARRETTTEEEQLLPACDKAKGVAFFVQVAPNNVAMLKPVMERLYHPDNPYLVHFDSKIEDEVVGDAAKFLATLGSQNIEYLEPRQDIRWASISVVLNLISGMSVLLDSPLDWSHLVFVSPTNMPLVSPGDLRDLLAEFPGQSFVADSHKTEEWERGKARMKMDRIRVDPVVYGLEGNQWKTPIQDWTAFGRKEVAKGELWQVMSRADAAYSIHSENAHRLLVRLNAVFAPDEWYFSNMMAQRERIRSDLQRFSWRKLRWEPTLYRDYITPINDALLYIVWIHPEEGRNRRGHPYVLDSPEMYLPELSASGALFARKFDDSAGSLRTIEAIDGAVIGNETYLELVRARMRNGCPITRRLISGTCRIPGLPIMVKLVGAVRWLLLGHQQACPGRQRGA